jgi:hypothetical protein
VDWYRGCNLGQLCYRDEAQAQVGALLMPALAPINAEPADEMDEAALVATIDAALQGTPPVSEVLLTERHEGP